MKKEGEIEIKGDDDVCVFVSYHPSSFISHENPTKKIDFKNTNLLERECVCLCGGAS